MSQLVIGIGTLVWGSPCQSYTSELSRPLGRAFRTFPFITFLIFENGTHSDSLVVHDCIPEWFDPGAAAQNIDIGFRLVNEIALASNHFMPWVVSREDTKKEFV